MNPPSLKGKVDKMRHSFKFLAVLLLAVLVACSQQGSPESTINISIAANNSAISSQANRVDALSVELFSATVSGVDDTRVRWTVDNSQVILVNANSNTVKLVLPAVAADTPITLSAISLADDNARASIRLLVQKQAQQARIEFVSQPALTLSRNNMSQDIEVRVINAYGDVVPNAAVTFTSSNPSAIAVSTESNLKATVRAQNTEASSAVITARYEGLEAVTNVAIAETRSNSKFIERSFIQDRSATELKLHSNAFTQSLAMDDILISNSDVGLLNRVTSVRNQGDTVILGLSSASLAEAYEDLDIHAKADRIDVEAKLVGENTAIITSRSARGHIIDAHVTSDFHCYTDKDVEINLNITPPHISLHKSLDFEVNLDTHWFIVEKFNVLVNASAGIDVSAGAVTFDITGEVSGHCEYKLEKEISATVHLLALHFQAFYDATVGFEYHKSVTDASVTIAGPSAGVRASATFGFEYIKHRGWHTVFEKHVSGHLTPFHVSADYGCGFAYKFNPYLEVNMGYSVTLGTWWPIQLAKSKFAHFRVFANLEAKQPCQEPGTCGYEGAYWVAEAGLEASLEASLSKTFDICLGHIGIHHSLDLSAELSVEKSIHFGSPTLTLTSSAEESKVNQPITFDTSIANPLNHHHGFLSCWLDDHGNHHEMTYVVCDENGEVYSKGTVSADETSSFDWKPDKPGKYTIYTMLPSNYGSHYYTSNKRDVTVKENPIFGLIGTTSH